MIHNYTYRAYTQFHVWLYKDKFFRDPSLYTQYNAYTVYHFKCPEKVALLHTYVQYYAEQFRK